MVKYDADKVISKLYQIIVEYQKNQKYKTQEEQQASTSKQHESLHKFKTLLIEFLNDETTTNDTETTYTSPTDRVPSKGGGLRDLRQGVIEVVDVGKIWKEKIVILSSSKISSAQALTLMQFVTVEKLPEFLQILLDEGLDPNYFERSQENDNDGSLPPVLLAAKKGHSEILKLFRSHNFNIHASADIIVINEKDDMKRSTCCSNGKNENEMQSISLKSLVITNREEKVKRPCNFSVWSSNGETVFHLIFKEPEATSIKRSVTKESEPAKDGKLDENYADMKEKRRNRRKKIRENYEKCLDVILSPDPPSQFHEKQIK